MGYEARVLPNASKAQVLNELNRLIEESGPNDSVALYFAGHGTVVQETGEGYWLPSDARADDSSGWLSNADINRALSAIAAGRSPCSPTAATRARWRKAMHCSAPGPRRRPTWSRCAACAPWS